MTEQTKALVAWLRGSNDTRDIEGDPFLAAANALERAESAESLMVATGEYASDFLRRVAAYMGDLGGGPMQDCLNELAEQLENAPAFLARAETAEAKLDALEPATKLLAAFAEKSHPPLHYRSCDGLCDAIKTAAALSDPAPEKKA